MVNVILNFIQNKKNKNSVVAFHNKKSCFVLKDSKQVPKPGEYWECFLWVEKEKYNLVKLYNKIDEKNLEKEKERVNEFNKELKILNSMLKKEDFQKIVFNENNRPFLLSNKPFNYLREKYNVHIIRKKEEGLWLRPVLNPEDRKEFQRMVM